MDPLSISVAIIGLIGSAEAVRRKVKVFLERVNSAGSVAELVHSEVKSVSASLTRLKASIENGRFAISDGIYLDQISTLLTGCVKQLAILESIIGGLPTVTEAESQFVDPATWSKNERRIRAAIEQIQLYKASLALMLQILELEALKEQSRTLERMQMDLDLLKGRVLATDSDLATRITNAEPPVRIVEAPSTTGTPIAELPQSPRSPVEMPAELRSRRPSLRPSWRKHSSKSEEIVPRTTRPPSITTTASLVTTGSTISTGSTASHVTLSSLSSIGTYRLPITPEELPNGHHYMGLDPDSIKELTSADADEAAPTFSALTTPPLEALPVRPRSGPDSRAESAMSIRPPPSSSAKPPKVPEAELEMTARKYQGYWRASFTANVPAATAMSGAMLLLAGSSSRPAPKLTDSAEAMQRAASLCEALNEAPSPAKVIMTLHSHSLETVFLALKSSLATAKDVLVPAKIAFGIYEKINEAKGDPKKVAKAWQHVAKALKKLPQETTVLLMFVALIGRRLRVRGLAVGDRSAAGYLMEAMWPQGGSKTLLTPQDVAVSKDAVSKLLLDNFDDIPDELPIILQGINYRFESGSRCDLLALMSPKRGPSG